MLLEVEDVSHRYGPVDVLHRIDLTVEAGECLAIVGANGAGKSTLLRLVTGRERPSEGLVTFDGAEVSEDDLAVRLGVAAVLGDPAFYPDLTAREHLELVAAAFGLGRDAQTLADEELRNCGLATRGEELPATFSAGQKQALFLAAALIRPRRLLVLDEPEQHLDPDARRALGERFRALAGAGVAVVFSTHQTELARAAADRALVLRNGRTYGLGAARDVLDRLA